MHFIFLFARIYPYVALALTMVLVQLAVFYRRRKNPLRWSCIGAGVFLMAGALAWFVFRGDLYSDDWVRALLGLS